MGGETYAEEYMPVGPGGHPLAVTEPLGVTVTHVSASHIPTTVAQDMLLDRAVARCGSGARVSVVSLSRLEQLWSHHHARCRVACMRHSGGDCETTHQRHLLLVNFTPR